MKIKKRTKRILILTAMMAVFLMTSTTAFAVDEGMFQVLCILQNGVIQFSSFET